MPTSEVSQLTTQQHLLAGCIAGGAATAVTYPFETLRTHMAMGSHKYGTVFKCDACQCCCCCYETRQNIVLAKGPC